MLRVKHELVYCPRCNTRFECKVGSVLICQCSTVKLNEVERNYIRERYDDCLCAGCMREMRAEYHNNNHKKKINESLGISGG